jgi:hypothetical protein
MAHHLAHGTTHVMSSKSYGTKIYLAPESYCETIDGKRMYSIQTDIWQCGTYSPTYAHTHLLTYSLTHLLTHLLIKV